MQYNITSNYGKQNWKHQQAYFFNSPQFERWALFVQIIIFKHSFLCTEYVIP
jgi:hypothetical protein